MDLILLQRSWLGSLGGGCCDIMFDCLSQIDLFDDWQANLPSSQGSISPPLDELAEVNQVKEELTSETKEGTEWLRVWPHHWYQLLSHTTTDEFWTIIMFCSGGRADVRRGVCGGRGGAPAPVRLGWRRDPRRRRHQHWQQEQQGKLHQQQHWQGIKISTSWTKSVWHADFSNQNNIQFLNIKVLEVYDEETCMEMMRSYYEVK